jgi:hypothetical protein
MFAAVDNTVILPGYTRADAAVFFSINERVALQANVEFVQQVLPQRRRQQQHLARLSVWFGLD